MDVGRVWQEYKIPIILGSVSLFLILLSITLLIKSYQTTTPIQFSSDNPEASVAGVLSEIIGDVQGAVVNPGVYRLPNGARVEEAIIAAGGLNNQADTERIATTINRAAKLSDGSKLYIPLQGDSLKGISSQSGVVSVNTSTQAELEALPGVGPVIAKKIIDGRPYMNIEELLSKKVLGQSLFNKLKEQLTL